jgi:hypothetical protein
MISGKLPGQKKTTSELLANLKDPASGSLRGGVVSERSEGGCCAALSQRVPKTAAMFRAGAMKDFRQMKQRGEKITALTAHDYPRRVYSMSGIDIILVGAR